MLLGEKPWSTIQTKTRTTKVIRFLRFVLSSHGKLPYVHYVYICAHNLPRLLVAEVAEAKFKEVMISYEAIKVERQNGSC
jgi:hypothetical protein